MVKRSETILVVFSIMFLGLILGQGFADAQPPEITIEALSHSPEAYVDKEVVVRGKLIVIGDYWRDPKFVIVDEKGDRFPINAFLPLSITPPQMAPVQVMRSVFWVTI